MFEVSVVLHFSAGHRLRAHKGKCENLHGHNWKVQVAVSSETLNSIGMVVDFKDLKSETSKILDRLDHTYLNDFAYFKKVNPTSENIAKYIYNRLTKLCKVQGARCKVKVWETDTSCATYYETTNFRQGWIMDNR